MPIQAITGKSRAKQIAEARHVAMYLLREDAELALKQIGLLLGHRDHSTVIHGVQKISTYVKTAKGRPPALRNPAQVRSCSTESPHRAPLSTQALLCQPTLRLHPSASFRANTVNTPTLLRLF